MTPVRRSNTGPRMSRELRTEHAATNEPGAGKSAKTSEHQESATAPKTNDSGESADTSTPTARQQRVEQRRKGMKGQAAAPKTSTNAAGAAAGAGAASSVPATGQQNAQANAGAKAKKPDPQQVQQIKSQHANFRAQPKPQQVPAVTYNQNYRIQGSEQLAGSAIRSIPLVSSGMARSGMVSLALHPRGADRWRLLLLEQRLLVSGMGLQSFGPILCLRRTDLCRVNVPSRRIR